MFEIRSEAIVLYFFVVVCLGLLASVLTAVQRSRDAGGIRYLRQQDCSVAIAWTLIAPPFAGSTILYGYALQYVECHLGWAFALGLNLQFITACFALVWWTTRREQLSIEAAQPREMKKAEV